MVLLIIEFRCTVMLKDAGRMMSIIQRYKGYIYPRGNRTDVANRHSPQITTHRVRYAIILAAIISYLTVSVVCAETSRTFKTAMRRAHAGKLDQAISLWSKDLKQRPKSYSAYVNRGTAYMMTGRVKKAISDWAKAAKYAPVFSYGIYREDFIDEAPGNTAILNFAKSLELDPEYIPSVLMMGALYIELGREEAAVGLYKEAVDLTRNPMLKSYLDYWIASLED